MTKREALMTKREALRILTFMAESNAVTHEAVALSIGVKALQREAKLEAASEKGGTATLKRHGRKHFSKISKGRPATMREEAKRLGVKLPRGVSRQRIHQILKEARTK